MVGSIRSLFALLGATLGWCAGMLLAPFQHEKEIFAGFSKTVAGFLSGYLVGKIETVWDIIVDEKHRQILFDPILQRRVLLCTTCFFLIAAMVFKLRSYVRKPD